MASRANFSSQALAQPGLIAERNALVGASRRPAIVIEGLREFRKALATADAKVTKIINTELRVAAGDVTREAARLAPRRTGRLAGSVRPFASGNRVGVRSPLPYANLIQWGGSTGRGRRANTPWSGSTLVRPSLFVTRAVENREAHIVAALGDAMERALVQIASDSHNSPLAG